MSDYISRQALLERIKPTEKHSLTASHWAEVYYKIVECFPSADVRENVRGEWIFHKSTIEGTDDSRECSVCGVWLNWTMPRNSFCPNCGAQMIRGES